MDNHHNHHHRARGRLSVVARQLTAAADPTDDTTTAATTTSSSSSSVWAGVPAAPADPILGVAEAFRASADPAKLNLGVGAYRDEGLRPCVLQAVRLAEGRLAEQTARGARDKEYLPIGGGARFCELAARLAFGEGCAALGGGRVATVQALSGTGALRVGAEFVRKWYGSSVVLLPSPTWGNHVNVFAAAGFRVERYSYYRAATRGLDYDALLQDLNAAPPGAVVVLHACAHNPTGVDPSPEQWRGILGAVRRRQLLPFFDSAYQGFASGDLDRDAAALRMFEAAGCEMLLAQSFAKNMGLYGERVGALHVVCACAPAAARVRSQLCAVARPMYSSPPIHGAAIAALVLSDPELLALWKRELKAMADRILAMRAALRAALEREGGEAALIAPAITSAIGMFSYTGLSPTVCARLTRDHAVFLTADGRISMAGLSAERCGGLAKAIGAALREEAAAAAAGAGAGGACRRR